MGIATTQQLKKYYDTFKTTEINFTKEVIQAMDFNEKQSLLRLVDADSTQSPCIIYAASMMSAKVLIPKTSKICEKISGELPVINLKLSFFEPTGKNDISFYVSGKVAGSRSYRDSTDLLLLNIEYTQRAPDDLIEKLGLLLDAKITTSKRADERIQLDDNAMRKLGLTGKETIVSIDSIPRRCILRDISFSGAKFIISGIASFLLNKECILKFTFEEPSVIIGLKGKIVRAEVIEGRKDLIAVAMSYDSERVTLAYKVRLTQYFNQQRKLYGGEEQRFSS